MPDKTASNINNLEKLIIELQKKYEQFFSHNMRTEPLDAVRQVEDLIRNYARGQIKNPVLSFRYNNLVARYNSYKNVWDRRRRKMEGAAPHSPHALKKETGREETYTSVIEEGPIKEGQIVEIFNHYIALRKQHNEPVDNIRLENFKTVLAEHVGKLRKNRGCSSVLIKVEIHQDKSRISAKAFK